MSIQSNYLKSLVFLLIRLLVTARLLIKLIEMDGRVRHPDEIEETGFC